MQVTYAHKMATHWQSRQLGEELVLGAREAPPSSR